MRGLKINTAGSNTIPLVSTTLQVAIIGKERQIVHYALSYGMRHRIVQTTTPKAVRGGIGKLNNPAKRRVLPVIL